MASCYRNISTRTTKLYLIVFLDGAFNNCAGVDDFDDSQHVSVRNVIVLHNRVGMHAFLLMQKAGTPVFGRLITLKISVWLGVFML